MVAPLAIIIVVVLVSTTAVVASPPVQQAINESVAAFTNNISPANIGGGGSGEAPAPAPTSDMPATNAIGGGTPTIPFYSPYGGGGGGGGSGLAQVIQSPVGQVTPIPAVVPPVGQVTPIPPQVVPPVIPPPVVPPFIQPEPPYSTLDPFGITKIYPTRTT